MIAAVEPCSFIDFPGRLAAVAFSQGCDLRCRYCHNPGLRERKPTSPEITDEFLRLLARRRGLLSGVVICGGEPTLWADLEPLLRKLRSMGFATKLDTNGLHPERTRELIDRGLIDYLAVDIKAAPGESSRWLCGHDHQGELALETLAHAVAAGVPCEARTVLVRDVHTIESVGWIAESLAAGNILRWRLSDVRTGRVLDPGAPLAPPDEAVGIHAMALARRLALEAVWIR